MVRVLLRLALLLVVTITVVVAGQRWFLAADAESVPGAIKALTDGGAYVSVDALGVAETCRNSVRSLARRGTHVQIGLTSSAERGEISLPTDAMTMQELSFVGSFGMPPVGYDEIFRMVARGALDPGAVVSDTIALDDVPDTLAAMSDYGTMGIPVVTEF